MESAVRSRNASDSRCNALLQKFLQERSTWKQTIAQKRANQAAQSLEICVVQYLMTLSDDLLFKIFTLLPAESLFRIQFVCKKWFILINSSLFIKYHTQQPETVLICKKLALSSSPSDESPKSYFHFLDFDHQKDSFVESSLINSVHVLSSCEGLVLAKLENNEKLIITNPVTRKHTEIPLGTSSFISVESYNLAFCKQERTYKVVHLFFEKQGHISTEILSIATRTWKSIDRFSSDQLLLIIMQASVSIDGSLYWMPHSNGSNDYIIALDMQDRKFTTKKLPVICSQNDRLVEIGGVLGLVTQTLNCSMQVWTLLKKDSDSNENWTKMYDINLNFNLGCSPIPLCSPKKGKEMLFAHHQDLHVYNFDKGEMKLVYSRAKGESIERLYIPHRNTFASWEDKGL